MFWRPEKKLTIGDFNLRSSDSVAHTEKILQMEKVLLHINKKNQEASYGTYGLPIATYNLYRLYYIVLYQ